MPQIFTSLEIRVSPLNDLTLAPIWEELSLEDSLYVEFMHSGLLPGKASVTLNVAERFEDGESLYFYYCNPDKEKLDLVAANLLVENGYVTLPMEHCSEYILTTEAVVVSDTSNPQTGDANPFGLITAMLTALVGCGTILAKKGFEK